MSKEQQTRPLQPMSLDEHGVMRFEANAIVEFLLDRSSYDMNSLTVQGFSEKDWEQFAALIGYSVSGWGGLSYVSTAQCNKADELAANAGIEPEETKVIHHGFVLIHNIAKIWNQGCDFKDGDEVEIDFIEGERYYIGEDITGKMMFVDQHDFDQGYAELL